MAITDSTGHDVPDDDDQAASDLTTLVELVAEMRNRQCEYFRTRNGTALSASKRAERAVDAFFGEIQRGDMQTRLF